MMRSARKILNSRFREIWRQSEPWGLLGLNLMDWDLLDWDLAQENCSSRPLTG